MKILVVEDEEKIAKYTMKALLNEGFVVDYAQNFQEAQNAINIYDYDCVILDLNLPDKDGLEIFSEFDKRPPTLIVSARDSSENIIEGFEAGTDDYLTKPFEIKELVLRVRALIRRNSNLNDSPEIELSNKIKFNQSKRVVYKEGVEVDLNNKELGILEYLLANRGKAISQEELLEHVWDREIDPFTDTVRTNIKTLRKKIDSDKSLIKTIRGRGYVINNV